MKLFRLEHAYDGTGADADDVLSLPFAARRKTRQRVSLASGREAALTLPRGSVLRSGDVLIGDGMRVRIEAAPEHVSVARGAGVAGLLRAAYHLGNRHVAVELGDAWLAYLHDHVLDAMVRGLGLEVRAMRQPFEPEAGAYAAHAHHTRADAGVQGGAPPVTSPCSGAGRRHGG